MGCQMSLKDDDDDDDDDVLNDLELLIDKISYKAL